MDLGHFEDELDRHGADLSRWPAGARAGATALLNAAPAARAALDAMRRLEDLLRLDASAGPPHAAGRFAAAAMRHRQSARPAVTRTAWAAAAVAAMAFGLVVGDLLPDRHADPANLVSAAFATPDPIDVD